MAREIRRREEREQTVLGLLRDDTTKAKLQASLARVGVTPERMVSWAMTALRREPKLMKCDPYSLLGAVIQSAQLGLDPSGVTGQAYLIPFGREVTLIPGYKGLVALARRSGKVSEIMAHAVYEKDEFEYEFGLDSKLRHVPSRDGDRGPLTFVYAYAKFTDGGKVFDVLSKAEVDKVRRQSSSGGSPAWKEHYPAMACKTAVRRLAKWLPLQPDEARGFELAGMEESGQSQRFRWDPKTGSTGNDEVVPVDAEVSDVAEPENVEPAPRSGGTTHPDVGEIPF